MEKKFLPFHFEKKTLNLWIFFLNSIFIHFPPRNFILPPSGDLLLMACYLPSIYFNQLNPTKKVNCWFLENTMLLHQRLPLTENLYQIFFCLLEFHKFTFVISGRPRLDLPPFSGHLFQSVWKSDSIVVNILRASEGLKIRKILQKNVAKYVKVNHQFPEVICCMWQNVVQC